MKTTFGNNLVTVDFPQWFPGKSISQEAQYGNKIVN